MKHPAQLHITLHEMMDRRTPANSKMRIATKPNMQ